MRKIKSLVKHLNAWWHNSEWVVLPEIPNTVTGSWEYVITEHFLFETVSNYVSKNGKDAFSRYVLDDDTQDKIIDILHFYHVRKKEKGLRIKKLWDRVRGIKQVCYKKSNLLTQQCYHYNTSKVEHDALVQLIMELEYELHHETQAMLHFCIDIR